MMIERATVALTGASYRDGEPIREAVVRALRGDDELAIAQAGAAPAASRATTLLARCVEVLGDRAATADDLRSLTAGDRERLLLHVRRLSVGDRLSAIVRCPRAGCGERLDVVLPVGDLIAPVYDGARAEYEATLEADDGARYFVRFRLPTGADQEAAAHADPTRTVDVLLDRCLRFVARAHGTTRVPLPALPDAARRAFSDVMETRDPQADIRLDAMCPACGDAFVTLFDAISYLEAEIAGRPIDVLRDVHTLALAYHWSEDAILALSRPRRHLYLKMLDAARGTGRQRDRVPG